MEIRVIPVGLADLERRGLQAILVPMGLKASRASEIPGAKGSMELWVPKAMSAQMGFREMPAFRES